MIHAWWLVPAFVGGAVFALGSLTLIIKAMGRFG